MQSCTVALDVSVQPVLYLAAVADAGSDVCGVAEFLRGGWSVFFSDELAAFRGVPRRFVRGRRTLAPLCRWLVVPQQSSSVVVVGGGWLP